MMGPRPGLVAGRQIPRKRRGAANRELAACSSAKRPTPPKHKWFVFVFLGSMIALGKGDIIDDVKQKRLGLS